MTGPLPYRYIGKISTLDTLSLFPSPGIVTLCDLIQITFDVFVFLPCKCFEILVGWFVVLILFNRKSTLNVCSILKFQEKKIWRNKHVQILTRKQVSYHVRLTYYYLSIIVLSIILQSTLDYGYNNCITFLYKTPSGLNIYNTVKLAKG